MSAEERNQKIIDALREGVVMISTNIVKKVKKTGISKPATYRGLKSLEKEGRILNDYIYYALIENKDKLEEKVREVMAFVGFEHPGNILDLIELMCDKENPLSASAIQGFIDLYVEREKSNEAVRKQQAIRQMTEKHPVFLFYWDRVPGKDNRLVKLLKQNFDIDWVETAKIEKMDYGKTIKVSTDKNYLLLKLNDEKSRVDLKIDDGRTDEFIAKTEDDELNIYALPGKEGYTLEEAEKIYEKYQKKSEQKFKRDAEDLAKLLISGAVPGIKEKVAYRLSSKDENGRYNIPIKETDHSIVLKA